MKGFFIVFEGIDGSGKGTLISGVKKLLLAQGFPEEKILFTAEPTKGFYGKKVRELLKSEVNPDVNAKQFLDLYVADRREHVEKEIVPALREGKIILCDRFKYSTIVYQSLQGIPIKKILGLHENFPVPDLVFILDLPADIALQRIKADSKRQRLEAFEKKIFLEKVRHVFMCVKTLFPEEKILVVDASRGAKEVEKEVAGILIPLLGKK